MLSPHSPGSQAEEDRIAAREEAARLREENRILRESHAHMDGEVAALKVPLFYRRP